MGLLLIREGFSLTSVELCQNERRGQMCADVGVIILAEEASSAKAPCVAGLNLVIQESEGKQV